MNQLITQKLTFSQVGNTLDKSNSINIHELKNNYDKS